MKKRLMLVLCVVLCLALSGCMKMNMTVDVDNEGKATASVKFLVSKDFLDQSGTDEESFYKDVKGEDYEKIKEEIDGTEYIGYEIKSDKSTKLTTKVIDGKVTLTLPMDSFNDYSPGMSNNELNDSGYSAEQLKAFGMEMNLVVNMPSKPETNVGTVDGNSVKIDLLKLSSEGQKDDIVISSELPTTNLALYIGIGVVVLAIIVIIIVVMKKKKKNGSENEPEQAEEVTYNVEE